MATASASGPSAAATACSWPGSTRSRLLSSPTTPSPRSSTAAVASTGTVVEARASRRARRAARSRSATRSRDSASRRASAATLWAATARSCAATAAATGSASSPTAGSPVASRARALAPQLLEAGGGLGPAGLGLGEGAGDALGLGVGGLAATAQRRHLPAQPADRLRAAGPLGGALPGRALGLLVGGLRRDPRLPGGLQRRVACATTSASPACSVERALGDRRELVEVGDRAGRGLGEQPRPLVGDPGDAAQPVVDGPGPAELLGPGVGARAHPGLLGAGPGGGLLGLGEVGRHVGEALGGRTRARRARRARRGRRRRRRPAAAAGRRGRRRRSGGRGGRCRPAARAA